MKDKSSSNESKLSKGTNSKHVHATQNHKNAQQKNISNAPKKNSVNSNKVQAKNTLQPSSNHAKSENPINNSATTNNVNTTNTANIKNSPDIRNVSDNAVEIVKKSTVNKNVPNLCKINSKNSGNQNKKGNSGNSLEKISTELSTVLRSLRHSVDLMNTSSNPDSYSDIVLHLEEMCRKNEAIFPLKVAENKNPTAKTSSRNSNTINKSKTSSSTVRPKSDQTSIVEKKKSELSKQFSRNSITSKPTRDSLASREYYNPLGVLKDEVDEAIKNRKTFTIRGAFPAIRRSLINRGWVEKYPPKIPEDLKKYQNYSISELVELQRNKEIAEICKKMIKSKLLMNHQVDLYYDHGFDAFRECPDSNKMTVINKFRREVFSYTSKQGLCEAAKDSYWFQIPGVSDINHPRSYALTKKGDTKGFIKDFNVTAAMSLLKWIVRNSITRECKILSPSGKIPLKVFAFAITECYKFIKQLKHEDIDNEIQDALDYDWHEFLEYFYRTVHVGNHFKMEDGADEYDMVRKSTYILNLLKKRWRYLDMDGMMNIWILKPTNGSRGIGIHICRTLEYVLNIVKKNPNRRYVIQKYIERPFLIHDTKFDIRQWFLISCADPLTIWIYKLCYLRFSSETYNLRKLHESIHLTNNSVQSKYMKEVKRNIILPAYYMWDSKQFKAYLSDIGYPNVYQDIIYSGMKQSITAAVLMHQDKMDKRKNCFELYGADFILTEDFHPWLLEINSNPALHASTPVTSRMCPQVLEDVIKVVIDFDRNPKSSTGNFELIYKQNATPQPKRHPNLEANVTALQPDYFYEPAIDQQLRRSFDSSALTLIQEIDQIDPSEKLRKINDTVKNTLQSLLVLLKKEKEKRHQQKSISVETRSLCYVSEKTTKDIQIMVPDPSRLCNHFSKESKESTLVTNILYENPKEIYDSEKLPKIAENLI